MQLGLTWNQPHDQPGQNSEVSLLLPPGFKGMHHLVWLKEFSESYFLKNGRTGLEIRSFLRTQAQSFSAEPRPRSQALSLCGHISQLPFTKQDKVTERDSQRLFILDNTVQNTSYRIMHTEGTLSLLREQCKTSMQK